MNKTVKIIASIFTGGALMITVFMEPNDRISHELHPPEPLSQVEKVQRAEMADRASGDINSGLIRVHNT